MPGDADLRLGVLHGLLQLLPGRGTLAVGADSESEAWRDFSRDSCRTAGYRLPRTRTPTSVGCLCDGLYVNRTAVGMAWAAGLFWRRIVRHRRHGSLAYDTIPHLFHFSTGARSQRDRPGMGLRVEVSGD